MTRDVRVRVRLHENVLTHIVSMCCTMSTREALGFDRRRCKALGLSSWMNQPVFERLNELLRYKREHGALTHAMVDFCAVFGTNYIIALVFKPVACVHGTFAANVPMLQHTEEEFVILTANFSEKRIIEFDTWFAARHFEEVPPGASVPSSLCTTADGIVYRQQTMLFHADAHRRDSSGRLYYWLYILRDTDLVFNFKPFGVDVAGAELKIAFGNTFVRDAANICAIMTRAQFTTVYLRLYLPEGAPAPSTAFGVTHDRIYLTPVTRREISSYNTVVTLATHRYIDNEVWPSASAHAHALDNEVET